MKAQFTYLVPFEQYLDVRARDNITIAGIVGLSDYSDLLEKGWPTALVSLISGFHVPSEVRLRFPHIPPLVAMQSATLFSLVETRPYLSLEQALDELPRAGAFAEAQRTSAKEIVLGSEDYFVAAHMRRIPPEQGDPEF